MIPFSTADLDCLKLLGSAMRGFMPGNITCPANNNPNLVNGNVYYSCVYLPTQTTITNITCFMNLAGSYTPTNFNGAAWYSTNGQTGLLTQQLISANTGALWTAAAGKLSIPYTAPAVFDAGVYFAAFTYNRSAEVTAPKTQFTSTPNNTPLMDFPNNLKLQGIGSLTAGTFPATVNMSAIAVNFGAFFCYPT